MSDGVEMGEQIFLMNTFVFITSDVNSPRENPFTSTQPEFVIGKASKQGKVCSNVKESSSVPGAGLWWPPGLVNHNCARWEAAGKQPLRAAGVARAQGYFD